MLGNILFCGLLIFSKLAVSKYSFRKSSECQTVWIQIRPDILLGLIWVQSACKSYQQMTLADILLLRLHKTSVSFIYFGTYNMGLWPEKTCLWGVANNTGADQPAHLCRLISAFVIRFSENTMCKLYTGKISIF